MEKSFVSEEIEVYRIGSRCPYVHMSKEIPLGFLERMKEKNQKLLLGNHS
jgi:hypothetical protein